MKRRGGEKWREGGEGVEDVNAFGAAAVSEGADTSKEVMKNYVVWKFKHWCSYKKYLLPQSFFVQTDKKLKHIGFHENKVRK